MSTWINGWMDRWMDDWINRYDFVNAWLDDSSPGWICIQIEGWIDG